MMPTAAPIRTPDERAAFRRRCLRGAAAVGFVALVSTALIGGPALAAHPEVSLAGSNFEIDGPVTPTTGGANLKLDDAAPSEDWATVDYTKKPDPNIGQLDDSFGQGAKEDTVNPAVVAGSIPPNKSDLLNFGMYLEEASDEPGGATSDFLHLFWHRVQEPQGTTNMDFEFNQAGVPPAGQATTRTAGDLLIQYDLSQGGTNPTLWLSEWVTTGASSQCEASNSVPCWGDRESLTAAGDATGSINLSAIPSAESDGLGDVSPRTFGEATVDFSAIVGDGTCVSFGSAYLKSRSSDSFTSALKDFIAPVATPELTNCAKVIINKETVPTGQTEEFAYTTNLSYEENDATVEDPSFNLVDGGTEEITNVFFGEGLSVTETQPLASGWALTEIDCSDSSGVTVEEADIDLETGTVTFDLDDADDVLECTYTNTLQTGYLLIEKERKHAASGLGENWPHAGIDFTVTGGNLPEAGEVHTTGADGTVCAGPYLISSLEGVGNYTVTEEALTNYAEEAAKSVAVTLSASCAEAEEPATVTFLNTPLTDIEVSVDSLEPGGTFSSIECGTAEDPDSLVDIPILPIEDAQDDPSALIEDLQPGTYVCTFVIDP